MFNSLIRRRNAHPLGQDEAAFDSTTFSLTTAVPRPAERRDDERLPATLCIVKVATARGDALARVRNLSAGGLMAEIGTDLAIGEEVEIEMQSQRLPATVVWTREGTAGFKYNQDVDLGELLAGRKQRHGFRPRPPRLEVQCKASVRLGKVYYNCDVHDISLGGIKVEPIEEYCLGKDVVVVVESLRPIRGQVRWFADRKAGVVFDEALSFEELAEWVGKRLELASLKAAIKQR